MRFSKLVWVALGVAALVACQPAAAGHCGCSGWGGYWEPDVTWYAPNLWYPNYFGPPYPATSYLPVFYPGSPQETALFVRNQLALMGVPPLPVREIEPLRPPTPTEKTPPKPDNKPPKKDNVKLPEVPGK
jgi:hypothetical protein